MPEQLVRLFNNEPELLTFGTKALQTWFLCLPVIGFQIVASNFFQATGRTRSAIFLTLTRQIILLIPAILLFQTLGEWMACCMRHLLLMQAQRFDGNSLYDWYQTP